MASTSSVFWANCPVSSATCCSSTVFSSPYWLLSAVSALIDVALRSLCWLASNKCAASRASSAVSRLILDFCSLISVSRLIIQLLDFVFWFSLANFNPCLEVPHSSLLSAVCPCFVVDLDKQIALHKTSITRRRSIHAAGGLPLFAVLRSCALWKFGHCQWEQEESNGFMGRAKFSGDGWKSIYSIQCHCWFGYTRNWIPSN